MTNMLHHFNLAAATPATWRTSACAKNTHCKFCGLCKSENNLPRAPVLIKPKQTTWKLEALYP